MTDLEKEVYNVSKVFSLAIREAVESRIAVKELMKLEEKIVNLLETQKDKENDTIVRSIKKED